MVNYNTNIQRNTHNSLECKGFELVSQGVCVYVYIYSDLRNNMMFKHWLLPAQQKE